MFNFPKLCLIFSSIWELEDKVLSFFRNRLSRVLFFNDSRKHNLLFLHQPVYGDGFFIGFILPLFRYASLKWIPWVCDPIGELSRSIKDDNYPHILDCKICVGGLLIFF